MSLHRTSQSVVDVQNSTYSLSTHLNTSQIYFEILASFQPSTLCGQLPGKTHGYHASNLYPTHIAILPKIHGFTHQNEPKNIENGLLQFWFKNNVLSTCGVYAKPCHCLPLCGMLLPAVAITIFYEYIFTNKIHPIGWQITAVESTQGKI
jgi:hypothetical protein